MDKLFIAMQSMVQWMDVNINSERMMRFHDQVHKVHGDCTHMHYFAYSLGEMRKASQDVQDAVARFIHARVAMERAAEAISDMLGDEFDLPKPPVQIAEMEDGSVNVQTQDANEEQPQQRNADNDFSITLNKPGKYSVN